MLALLTIRPTASALTRAVKDNVIVPPGSTFTGISTLPVPMLALQLEPTLALHVQVAFSSWAGSVSLSCAPIAALGPALVAVIVYVVTAPGIAMVVPLDLVILKSAIGAFSVVEATAVLLVGLGSGVLLLTEARF